MELNRSKVLIVMVDDDEDDCFLIKEALTESDLNHELVIINDGLQLLDYLHLRGKYQNLESPYPDLILLDLFMPGINGKQVLREIKKDARLREIDVVVLTDSTDWGELQECYELGATAVFTKGQWLDIFAEVIRISGPYWFRFLTVRLGIPRDKPGMSVYHAP